MNLFASVVSSICIIGCSTGESFVNKFSKASRRPPLTPQRFGTEMKMREARAKERGVKLFTNGKDQPFVLNKYEKVEAQCRPEGKKTGALRVYLHII